jgi:hypothetical protein
MSVLEPIIREVREDDDFSQIRNLVMENKLPPMYFPNTVDGIRSWFFPYRTDLQKRRKGYLAVES